MNEYNTQRPKLVLREYGRNIQKLVEHLNTIEDKEKRNQFAETLVELMREINENIKDHTEYNQKLWDDIVIMSDFKLDIDSPFPKPEKEILLKKPQLVNYKLNKLKYKHYGRNIELLVEKAIQTVDENEKETFIIYIGKLMKSFYGTWNKDVVTDEVIIDHIRELSNNKLQIDAKKVKDNDLFEVLYKEKIVKPARNEKPKKSNHGGKRRKN